MGTRARESLRQTRAALILVAAGLLFGACATSGSHAALEAMVTPPPLPPAEGAPSEAVAGQRAFSPQVRDILHSRNHPSFAWPLRDPVLIQFYGWRTARRMHEGVDLRAGVGIKVFASAAGEVIYRGTKLKGYGRMIVIDHGNDFSSSYAHLSRYAVRMGQKVKRGQLIGYAGRSGRAKGPHLHFELRKGADPLDPLAFLWPRFDLNVQEENLDPES